MATKFQEFSKIEEIDSCASAIVHGAISSLSPIKRGTKSPYFDGTLIDDSARVRTVGFDQLQRKLQYFYTRKRPVCIQNCQIKQSINGDGFEIILKSNTKIIASEKND